MNTGKTLLDEHLDLLQGMKEAEPDDFFYTRLRARMERIQDGKNGNTWSFPLKPVWVASMLVLLLLVNGFMLSQQSPRNKPGNDASIQGFAQSYDLTVSPSY